MSEDQGKVEDEYNKVNDPTNDSGSSDVWNIRDWDNSGTFANNDRYKDPRPLAAKNDDWIKAFKAQVASKKNKNAYKQWDNHNGMLKVIPTRQIQLMSYSTVTDILDKGDDPVTQIFPISNASVSPHQISFDYFNTSEGKLGVASAAEKHMVVECDVYYTDLVYYWWRQGGTLGRFGFHDWKKGLNLKPIEFTKKQIGGKKNKKCSLSDFTTYTKDFEQTPEFAKMRDAFLTYFTGWECKFVTHVFPTFYGVITEIKYDISEGESFAKWHMKIEEALFLNYNEEKTDTKDKTQTSQDGDTGNSQTPSTGSEGETQ